MELYVSMLEYHEAMKAITADWGRAKYLADWFEENGMGGHAKFFRSELPLDTCGFYPTYPMPLYKAYREWFQRGVYGAIVNRFSGYWRGHEFWAIDYGPSGAHRPIADILADYKITRRAYNA